MEKVIFNKEYNKYWKNRAENAIDGSKVPDNNVISEIISILNIGADDHVLDLGCGYGRLFEVLTYNTSKVWGVDIDLSMINDASKLPYQSLHVAQVENTYFPNDYFDKIVSLGVFDVVDQEAALVELNRILKVGGHCVFSGKNIDYLDEDELAFVAERNAKIKGFPNHFTDVFKLIDNLESFGFSFAQLVIFPKRGDFGDNRKIINNSRTVRQFYEYCIFLMKEREIISAPDNRFTSEFSNTAYRKFGENKEDILELFKAHQQKGN